MRKTQEWLRHQLTIATSLADNWKPPREEQINRKWRNEHRLHKMRLMQEQGDTEADKRENMARKDAMQLAMRAKQIGKVDVTENMAEVEYWDYVKKHDRAYYDAVRNLGNEFIDSNMVERYLDQVKFVAPQQESEGGGLGMGLGASDKQVKNAMYLVRTDGKPYSLKGTIGGDIITGKIKYFGPDGDLRKIRLKSKGNVEVRRGSAAAKAIRLMEPVTRILEKEIAAVLGSSVHHPEDVAAATVERGRLRGEFDALPVTFAIAGPLRAMACMRRIDGNSLPEETKRVKSAIARIMAPYVDNLKNGLLQDGIKFVELGPYRKQKQDVAPAVLSSPSVLAAEDIEDSSDVRSLVMTMMADKGEVARLAGERMRQLVCIYPGLLEEQGFNDQDILALERSDVGKRVARLARLHTADDADLMSTYYDCEEDADLIVDLIAAQQRDNIINAAPHLCLRKGGLNVPYFARLSPTDETMHQVILDVLKAREEGVAMPDELVERKACSALLSCKSKGFANKLLSFTRPVLQRFALCWLLSQEDADHSDLIPRLQPYSDAEDEVALVALACIERGDQSLAREVQSRMSVSPSMLSMVAGRKRAIPYLKANRIDWKGNSIPRASEIFSAPENALSLARNLASIEDREGLLVLLRKCAEKGRRKRNRRVLQEMTSIIWAALESLGAQEEAKGLLDRMGMEFENGKLRDCHDLPKRPSANDIRHALNNGDEIGAAIMLDRVAEKDEARARLIMQNLPVPADPQTLLALLPFGFAEFDGAPEWACGARKSAKALPSGHVVIGDSSSYRIAGTRGKAFACSTHDLPQAVMSMLTKEETEAFSNQSNEIHPKGERP